MQNKLTGFLATLAGIGAFALAGWAGYSLYPENGKAGNDPQSNANSGPEGIEVQAVTDRSTGPEAEGRPEDLSLIHI